MSKRRADDYKYHAGPRGSDILVDDRQQAAEEGSEFARAAVAPLAEGARTATGFETVTSCLCEDEVVSTGPVVPVPSCCRGYRRVYQWNNSHVSGGLQNGLAPGLDMSGLRGGEEEKQGITWPPFPLKLLQKVSL
ncbi:Hypp9770 [Branchiostoma lanceolatum]|uniref:Hypp9770 protein n=1 Tax=Branchiostoma lanceolatum TaxID=7740 RepID=A0A8S4MPN7_BRALA|nr:Hypp9770 [Branchiostoma lanceolatum]